MFKLKLLKCVDSLQSYCKITQAWLYWLTKISNVAKLTKYRDGTVLLSCEMFRVSAQMMSIPNSEKTTNIT